LLRVPAVRRFAFRTISQVAVNYRASFLSVGVAGSVHGGDRLPWVGVGTSADEFNFAALTALDWQIHIYGDDAGDIRALSDRRKIPLHVFAWRPAMEGSGLRRGAVYLVRPDGYVALASPTPSAAAIDSYLDQRKIRAISPIFA
jgi:hypothetical protein